MTRPEETVLPQPVQLPRRTYVEQVMGLPVSVLLRGHGLPDDVEPFFAELRHVDAVFSTYRPDSEISRLRRDALLQPTPEVAEVLALCDQVRQETDGLFDCRLPELDPSGLVKGWAVERALRHLPSGDVDHCVTAGGDVVARCLPGRHPWRVGIEDPFDRARVVEVVELHDGALATSGTAARGLHIVDPRTGQAAASVASVSVRAASLMRADVLATAAFVRGADAADWIGRFRGVEAFVVGLDGGRSASSGWTPRSFTGP